MAVPLVLPALPFVPPAAAATATAAIGLAVYGANGLNQFLNPQEPLIPPGEAAAGGGGTETGGPGTVAPELPTPPPTGPPEGNGGPVAAAVAAAAVAAAAAGVVGDALSQFWGWVNSLKAPTEGTGWPSNETQFVPLPGPGTYTVSGSATQTVRFRNCQTGAEFGDPSTYDLNTVTKTGAIAYRLGAGASLGYTKPCGVGETYSIPGVEVFWLMPNGAVEATSMGGDSFVGAGPDQSFTITRSVLIVGFQKDGQPIPGPGVPGIGPAPGFPDDFVEPEPDKKPAPPLAPPLPPLVPQVPPGPQINPAPGEPAQPGPSPQPPGTPPQTIPGTTPGTTPTWQPGGPGTPAVPLPPGYPAPTVTPSTTPRPVPWPWPWPTWPVPQPTDPAGNPIPGTQPRPVTTPTTQVQVGPYPIPSNPPAPTLTGIAEEVGRIEKKLEIVLTRPEPQFPDISGLQELLENVFQPQPEEGAYELGGPCERDAEGNPIPFGDTVLQFEWGGKQTALADLASKVDALAELLQYHKLLRQPTCLKAPPALGGEWVSVNFEEVT